MKSNYSRQINEKQRWTVSNAERLKVWRGNTVLLMTITSFPVLFREDRCALTWTLNVFLLLAMILHNSQTFDQCHGSSVAVWLRIRVVPLATSCLLFLISPHWRKRKCQKQSHSTQASDVWPKFGLLSNA